MQYLLLIGSIILYVIAPADNYNLSICSYAFGIFLIASILGFYKLRDIEFYGFNLLFTISFFGCCYIFPIFIYNIDDQFSLFHHGYDYRVMTKSTCLASIAYSCYICGLLKKIHTILNNKIVYIDKTHRNQYLGVDAKSTTTISIFFFALFILSGGYSFLRNQYSEGAMDGGIISYFYVLVTLIPILLTYTLNCQFKKKYLLISFAFIVILLITGSRTHPLALILGIFYIYNLRNKVPAFFIIILLFVGLVGMAILGTVRGGQDMETESSVGFWSTFLDLIVNNRNLYDSYSLVRAKGILPTVFLGPILAVIPMGQSLFCSLTGISDTEMRSSLYITIEHFGSNPPVGLGTNIVGDVYLGGGLVAIILLFYLLGRWVTRALYAIYIEKNITWFIFYISLVTSGIFICRGSFFLFVRPFVWSMVILYSIKKIKQFLNKLKTIKS